MSYKIQESRLQAVLCKAYDSSKHGPNEVLEVKFSSDFPTKIDVRSNVGNEAMTGLVMLSASFVDLDQTRT